MKKSPASPTALVSPSINATRNAAGKIGRRRRYSPIQLCLAAALVAALPRAAAAPEQAAPDLIVHNARIVVRADAEERQEAMAVTGGQIVKIGQTKDILAGAGKTTKLYDAGGKLIVPGFHDSHIHLAEGAVEYTQLRLNEAKSKAEILAAIQAYVQKHKNLKEIIGHGISLPAVLDDKLTRIDLDKITDKPLAIYSEDGHSIWVNSKVLNRIPKDKLAPFDKQGLLDKLEGDANSGLLKEDAIYLVDSVIKGTSRRQFAHTLKDGLKLANSLGITSIQEAHATDAVLKAYYDLARRKELTLRVEAALHTSPNMDAGDLLKLQAKSFNYTTGNLRVRSAKIFLDGVVETGTAALLKPYIGKFGVEQNPGKDCLGLTNLDQARLNKLVAELVSRDFQIHIHAIGDRAVRMALDALEPMTELSAEKDLRHHIAHLELVDEQDFHRFHKLNVTANFQPYWAFRDPYVEKLTVPVLGARAEFIYPLGSLAKAGARLAAGSDWTVSTMNPLEAMQVAVTRQPINVGAAGDNANKPLNEKERLSIRQILAAYTMGGAYVNHSDKHTGSLEPGKYADFVVLDRDFINLPPQEIARTKVLATFLEGKQVYPR